jgi:hypothetical protein
MAVERRTTAGCRHGTGLWLALVVVLLTACAISDHPKPPPRIALLAPFEGRYRELGYEAYYAARLALTDSSTTRLELLAVDDGGSPELARLRAQAIQHNPAVLAVVVLGYTITDPTVLDAFADVPVIVVGDWGVDDVGHGRFALASSGFHDLLTIPSRTEVAELAMLPGSISGGEILSLTEFAICGMI